MTATAPLLFHGTLLNQHGDAVKEAKIQLWQTDLDGNYLHPNPRAAASAKSPEHASIVAGFQYFGTDATDGNGEFAFRTYRPGIYPNRPYSHFHFMVWLDKNPIVGEYGGASLPALVTQFYFQDESPPFATALQLDVTEVDPSMYDFGSYVNGTMIVNDSGNPALLGEELLAITPSEPEGPFYPEVPFFSMDNDLTTAEDATTPTPRPDVTTEITASPKLSPTEQPTTARTNATLAVSTAAPLQTALQTSHPTVAPGITAKYSAAPGFVSPSKSNGSGTLSIPTGQTLQPVHVPSSAAACTCCVHGFVGLLYVVACSFLWN